MLIVISGLPGTGKSAVAAAVATDLHAVHLSIDSVAEALLGAGLPQDWQTGVAAYEATRAAAEQNLALGRTVVIDAVNDSEPARDTWRTAAVRTKVPLAFFLLTLEDPVEHRRRLEGRVRDLVNVTEPSWQEVQQQATDWAPWERDCTRLDAADPIDVSARTIVRQLPTAATRRHDM